MTQLFICLVTMVSCHHYAVEERVITIPAVRLVVGTRASALGVDGNGGSLGGGNT